MADLVIPSRLTQQPQGAAQVDRSNPLARNLQMLLVPLGNNLFDIINPTQVWTPTGNAKVKISSSGFALSSDASASTYWSTNGYPQINGAVGTFFMWSPRIGSPSANGHVYFGTNTGTVAAFQIQGNTAFPFTTVVNGIPNVFNTANSSFAFVANGTAASKAFYFNGISYGTPDTNAPASFASGNKAFQFAAYIGGTTFNVDADTVIAGFTSDVWTGKEAAAFHANPWQLFKAPPRRLWLASSTPTGSGSLAWLEQNDITAISGVVTVAGSIVYAEANDTFAISGTVTNAGSLAWAEASDTTSISGNVTLPGASIFWTEANDVSAISATVTNAGSLSWTEANDTTALSAVVTNAGSLAWTEANDTTAISASATATNAGLLAWSEQNDTCQIIAAALVRGAVVWAEANDAGSISAFTKPTNSVAPLTPHVLNQPFNNSLFLDGILNDRSTSLSLLESVLPDFSIVNTTIVDQPIRRANQALIAIIPQV